MHIAHIKLPDFPLLLAPMEDVSDPPFRIICREAGADLLYTEFISSEGLVRHKSKALKKLEIFPEERPVGVQLYGGDEGMLSKAAAIVVETKPDLLDINFGCPVKGVVCKGAGAGVLKDIPLMIRLTEAVVRSTSLPVTVKTRLGWDADHINIEEVAERLQDVGISALTIHGRTRQQLYKGEADWSLIGKVKNNPRIRIPIFGNGDINSALKAKEYRDRYGVDGIMIGRAAIGYPWIFREIRHFLDTGNQLPPPGVSERIAVCRKHLLLASEWEGHYKAIMEMRGRYGAYLKGLPDVREFIKRLVVLDSIDAIEGVLDEVQDHYKGTIIAPQAIEIKNYHEHYSSQVK
jgi:nifR3 family TIM-barrel protein